MYFNDSIDVKIDDDNINQEALIDEIEKNLEVLQEELLEISNLLNMDEQENEYKSKKKPFEQFS